VDIREGTDQTSTQTQSNALFYKRQRSTQVSKNFPENLFQSPQITTFLDGAGSSKTAVGCTPPTYVRSNQASHLIAGCRLVGLCRPRLPAHSRRRSYHRLRAEEQKIQGPSERRRLEGEFPDVCQGETENCRHVCVCRQEPDIFIVLVLTSKSLTDSREAPMNYIKLGL
jgi:hypothetical protein